MDNVKYAENAYTSYMSKKLKLIYEKTYSGMISIARGEGISAYTDTQKDYCDDLFDCIDREEDFGESATIDKSILINNVFILMEDSNLSRLDLLVILSKFEKKCSEEGCTKLMNLAKFLLDNFYKLNKECVRDVVSSMIEEM